VGSKKWGFLARQSKASAGIPRSGMKKTEILLGRIAP